MLKRYRFTLMLSLAVLAITSSIPGPSGTARAQNRRVYLEEFTGAWCGYCVRGAYAINNLYASYPGQVMVVSIHSNNNGGSAADMMDIPQGDSLVGDDGFPAAESDASVGFPDGWTARSVLPGLSSWNVDPSAWAVGVGAQFGVNETDGIVAGLLAEPAAATVTVDNISFDKTTQQVTARVSVTFAAAESGDLRLNLMVTEDSVTGSGAGWDQHNYYSSQDGAGPRTNPLNNYPASIAGWDHMHVFRAAVGGIHGQAGIIPATVKAGDMYSTTFTFTLPSNIEDTDHVHLIGLVNAYSATDASANSVLDADEVPLIGPAPKYFITSITITSDNQYATATSNGVTPENVNFKNNGTDPVTLSLSVDPSITLPTGWSATISPDSITVNPGATGTAVLNVTAPEQSAYVGVSILATPVKEGFIVGQYRASINLLSDNTAYAVYTAGSAPEETALSLGIPDTVKLHTATMPLTLDILSNYDYSQYGAVFLNSIPILDFDADLGLGVTQSVNMIEDMLTAGAKVFINSDDAMGYAFDDQNSYFAQYAIYTETAAVQALYQQMGLDLNETVQNWTTNAQTGVATLTPFSITGEKGDPIGNGISATDGGGNLNSMFSIDSNSTPVFISSSVKATDYNIIGARYVDSSTGGRLVYLGFSLNELTVQSKANTIAANSIKWLFTPDAPAGVTPQAAASGTGITASPNPFNGISNIQYTAAQDELNVTFAAYDLLGRQVATLATQNEGGNVYSATFDASKLAAGTYTIMAHSTKGTHEIRVVNQQ